MVTIELTSEEIRLLIDILEDAKSSETEEPYLGFIEENIKNEMY